jgi:hypothetical protein
MASEPRRENERGGEGLYFFSLALPPACHGAVPPPHVPPAATRAAGIIPWRYNELLAQREP